MKDKNMKVTVMLVIFGVFRRIRKNVEKKLKGLDIRVKKKKNSHLRNVKKGYCEEF